MLNDDEKRRLQTLIQDPPTYQEVIALLEGSGNYGLYGAYPSDVYTVDLTAPVAVPTSRVYPTFDAALAAGYAAGIDNFAIHTLPGQAPQWTTAPVALTLGFTVRCAYGKGSLQIPAALALVGGTGKTVRFMNLEIAQAPGATVADVTGLDNVEFIDCDMLALGGQIWLGFNSVTERNTRMVGPRFLSTGVLFGFGGNWTPGAGFPAAVSAFQMRASTTSSFIGTSFAPEGIDDNTLFTQSLNNPVLELQGCNIAVENTGAGAASVFGASALLSVRLRGVTVNRTGAGVVNFGSAVSVAFPGLSWHGTDPDDAALPSGSWHNLAGSIVQVP